MAGKEKESLDFDGFKRKKVAVDGGGKRVSAGGGGSGGGMRCCQAEKCVADLSDAKPYYRRHRVCEHHSKAQNVIVDGIRQRFCQQCSRFHEIAEFDDTKRSCRRRLAGHNERRRKNFDATEGSGHKGKKLEDMVFGQVDDSTRIKITINKNVACKQFEIK